MFGKSKKATHVISNDKDVATVYGRKDLDRRLKAAQERGVEVKVRKLGRDER